MNIFSITTITFALTLLVACGGGGSSGGTAAAPTTPTPMMPGMDDMMTPPGTNDPMTTPPDNTPATLPTAPINATTARGYFTGSTIPSAMESDAIEEVFRTRASATGAEVLFEDIVEIGGSTRTTSCTDTTCTGTLSDNTSLEYSFSEFGNTPEINSQALLGFNDAYDLVMMDEGVILAQGRAAGRLEGTSYQFLNYGGWLANSAFGVQHETADGSGNNDLSYVTAYSFGIPSGSNPSVTGIATWEGVVVGASTQTGNLVQGRGRFRISADNQNQFSIFRFHSMRNLSTGATLPEMFWNNVSIDNGSFATADGSVQGTFYETEHTEVGGTFNRSNIIGAFGAVRE